MRRSFFIAILFLLIFSSCGKKKEEIIGFSVSTQNNPFFVTLVEGAKSEAEKLGIKMLVVDANDDTVKQTGDMEDMIAKNVKVLIVNPVDSSSVAYAVTQAKAAGIKVVSVDRSVIGEEVDCEISSDNEEGARKAGEYLLEMVGEGAKIAELQGILGASATIARGKGFHEAVDGKAEVVASLCANFNRVEGMSVSENLFQSHPDIKGIFAHNDEMALGAITAMNAAGKKIAVIGFDATDDALKEIDEGDLSATVAQLPKNMGKIAVQSAVKLMKNEKIEKEIPVDVSLIKKMNLK